MSKLTIDELARNAGTTTRNVRAHQSRGLLPPPEIVGRIGYYDDDHLTRLKLIAHLQDRGFGLSAINDLLSAWESGEGLAAVLGFNDALMTPWSDETPEVLSQQQLVEMFPEVADDPSLIERAVDLELLVPDAEGFKAPSPTLLRVGAELIGIGIPLSAVLDEAAALKENLCTVATRMVNLFTVHVWEPFLRGDTPERSLEDITKLMLRTRPLSSETVQAMLAQAMQKATEAAAAFPYEYES
jgi:DNA-binding transcriptional MerR regulator